MTVSCTAAGAKESGERSLPRVFISLLLYNIGFLKNFRNLTFPGPEAAKR